jgi:4-amino-4-deoxy-L-arabinose transferase-like glycosyltransferase
VLVRWLRGEGWPLAIRVLAPAGALVVEGWPALIGALVVQEGGLWLTGRLTEGCERTFCQRLFLAAYGLRVAIALPTHYVAKLGNGNGSLFPLVQDDYTNDLVAEWLLRMARGDGTISIFPGHQHLLDGLYPYLLMGMYAVFGYAPVLPKLLNAGLAALSAVLVFEMARRVFRRPAAVVAAIGATVLPTMVIWSVVSLKEVSVLFVAVLALRLVQFLSTAPSSSPRIADALVLLVALLALLIDLRPTTAVIVVGMALIVWGARSGVRRRLRSWQFGFAALALVLILSGGLWAARSRTSNRPLTSVVEDVVLQIRHRRAQEAAQARSQLRPEQDVLTATGSQIPEAEAASDAAQFSVSGDIVEPLAFALLAPAPWQARTLPELAAGAEMLIWYVLLGAACFTWQARPRQSLFVVCLLAYGITTWLVLAASEGNLGNLLRHRLLLDPVLLLLGCGGLDWLGRRQVFARHYQAIFARQYVD